MTIKPAKPLVYVVRDIERALGMEPGDGYFVISNDSPYGRSLKSRYPDSVWLIQDPRGTLDTYDLLALPEAQKAIQDRGASVLVFQNNPRIERLAAEKGWDLLNPPAALSRLAEEKISQIDFLAEDARFLPPHRKTIVKDVAWTGTRFVLQFNHSHTGAGTYVIESDAMLTSLKDKFPDRECRIVDFIDGPVFTVNAVVGISAGGLAKVLVGNPSYQITGLRPFTDLPYATVGNDWSLPHTPDYAAAAADVRDIADRVGTRLAVSGWKGLFGIDAVHDPKSGTTYLIEINARQPASATFESQLQKKADPTGTTTFEAHLLALTGQLLPDAVIQISSGSQIVQRVTAAKTSVDAEALRKKGYMVIEYGNTDHNLELFRIQSDKGIMKAHNSLSPL